MNGNQRVGHLAWGCMLICLHALGCGDDSTSAIDAAPEGAEPVECDGEPIVALGGAHHMVISSIEIGSKDDGLDLNDDGDPDNKFATLADLLKEPVADSFANYDIVLPIEFFDMQEPAADECVKIAVYSGLYRFDEDEDEHATAGALGDCDDHDVAVHPLAQEVPGNGIDDDCNGYADETIDVVSTDAGPMDVIVPSDDVSDADEDGLTVAAGDCNDHNPNIRAGIDEVCGDGFDNNCDGVADWTANADPAHCSPFDDELENILLDPESFADGSPIRAFKKGTVELRDGVLHLRAGPAVFPLQLPISADSTLDLVIGQSFIDADLQMTPAGWILQNARLGGMVQAMHADEIFGLDIAAVGLRPDDSLLDGIFAGTLGALLSLAFAPVDSPANGCLTPDIDVDGDGLEAFCDSNPDDDVRRVDRCVDGDGTVVADVADLPCSQAQDSEGNMRFVDGVSLVILFETVPGLAPRISSN